MLQTTQNKGFSMTFENNLTISVQFGTANYCSRKSYSSDYRSEMKKDIIESETAEIAIWDENDKWFNFGSDEVKGYCTSNEVAQWINKVANTTDINSITNEQ